MIVHRFAFVASIALLVATAAGCGAREGGVCQLDGDCASGLFCCKIRPDPATRGVCRPTGTMTMACATTVVDAATADAGDAGSDAGRDADVDAFTTGDAGSDAGDAGTVDSGAVDSGAVDTGAVDAGAVDSGSDAGGDADIDAG